MKSPSARKDEGYIAGPRGRIWYRIYGKGKRGTPLLVVHAGPGLMSIPEGVSELSDERPVIFYDQLGCGGSDRPADLSYASLEYYVEELGCVRKALGLDSLHLLGQCWGAMIVASYMLARRQAGVHSLVLTSPYLSSPRWSADQRAYLSAMPKALRDTITRCEAANDFGPAYQEAMMTYYNRHVCRLSPWPASLLDAMGRINQDLYWLMWGPSEFTITGSLKGQDLCPRLPQIKVPVLLVSGEHDEASVDTVRCYRDLLPSASMAVLPRASTSPALEQPALFQAVLRQHLQGIDASSKSP